MRLPNARERHVLQKLRFEDFVDVEQLRPAGPKTLVTMVDHGWIEKRAAAGSGADKVRITAAGRKAFKAPLPPYIDKRRTGQG